MTGFRTDGHTKLKFGGLLETPAKQGMHRVGLKKSRRSNYGKLQEDEILGAPEAGKGLSYESQVELNSTESGP